MAHVISELDSFYLKFNTLLRAGRNATLKIESKAGKAEVTLQVELRDISLPSAHLQHHRPHRPRNGPARQRRRERRAANREADIAVEVRKVQNEHIADVEETSTRNISESEIEVVTEEAAINEEEVKGIIRVQKQLNELKDFGDEKVAGEAKDDSEKVVDEAFKVSDKMIKSYRLSCEKCNKMWLDEDQYKYHMEMKHKKHVCVKCTSTLVGRENLRVHFREKHPAFVIASQLI